MNAVARLALNDEGFVFDPVSGESYVANPAAVLLLRGLQGGMKSEELEDELRSCYSLTATQAKGDVADLLAQLKGLRLI